MSWGNRHAVQLSGVHSVLSFRCIGKRLDRPLQISVLGKMKLNKCAPIAGPPRIGFFVRAGRVACASQKSFVSCQIPLLRPSNVHA
jgi:hypothetical protein